MILSLLRGKSLDEIEYIFSTSLQNLDSTSSVSCQRSFCICFHSLYTISIVIDRFLIAGEVDLNCSPPHHVIYLPLIRWVSVPLHCRRSTQEHKVFPPCLLSSSLLFSLVFSCWICEASGLLNLPTNSPFFIRERKLLFLASKFVIYQPNWSIFHFDYLAIWQPLHPQCQAHALRTK